MTKILVIAGGGVKHLDPFKTAGEALGVEVATASFSRLSFDTESGDLLVKGQKVTDFDTVYIRLVGKASESATFLASYCRKLGIRLVDKAFADPFTPIPLSKSIEARLITEAGLPYPRTLIASLTTLLADAPKTISFPFVIKGTKGKQGHEVWSPESEKELATIKDEIKRKLAKFGKDLAETNFIAQEFIPASQRTRVLVVGGRAVGAITRPTKWRKRFTANEGRRETLDPIPEGEGDLAVKAAAAVGLDVAGVDLLREDASGKLYVLEVNSAPRWASIKADTGVQVEEEIVKFLVRES